MNYKKSGPEDSSGEMMISHAKAAEMCGMTREAILNLVRRGRLASVEIEGRTLLFLKEVEAFELSERRANSSEGVEPESVGRV